MKNIPQKFNLFILGIAFIFSFAGVRALAHSSASATALATSEVVPSLSLNKTQDLSFGAGIPGDGPRLLTPTGSGTAQFQVTGGANASYSITLPADGTIFLYNSQGDQISVNQFRSFPESSGVLDASGSQTLQVGATRGAIDPNLRVGTYSGSFTVIVTYQ